MLSCSLDPPLYPLRSNDGDGDDKYDGDGGDSLSRMMTMVQVGDMMARGVGEGTP